VGIEYVLPLRWHDDAGLPELAGYVRWLAGRARVIVVDGSPDPLFAAHARAFGPAVLHLSPDRDLRFRNGKVNGVTTGLRRCAGEYVVIADDDVRYDDGALGAVAGMLADADLVWPQNYFGPQPWHARWDTARILLNRATGSDYPGTMAIRRSMFEKMGGYDGDVLFENLELIRTVRAAGGRDVSAPGVFVRRLPCGTRHFFGQRVRRAYDDFAQPGRLALFLACGPVAAALVRRRRWTALAAAAAGSVALAEAGRRRSGGRAVFGPSAPLPAPLWIAERAVCSWIALGARVLRGGVRYAGHRLPVAAHSVRTLSRPSRP
jgi:hypothetical protein